MPYTFNAAGSRCAWALNINASQTARVGLFTGWFLPSALTTGRYYFAAGNIFGARVAATTSEIEFTTVNATTNGVWATSGAGITVGEWRFIAILYVINSTGPTGIWRCWLGRPDSAPEPVTVNVTTAPVGALTGSTAAVIGNNALNASGYQGDIADCCWAITSSTGAASPFGVNVTTALAASEEAFVLQSWVWPLWEGEPMRAFSNRDRSGLDFNYWTAETGAQMVRHNVGGSQWVVPTLAGADSANGSPSRRRTNAAAELHQVR